MTFENKAGLPDKLLKPYNPGETEAAIYKIWEDSGFFNPDICVEKGVTKSDAKPFTIMMPPPNVTGVLHMGHAMMVTIEDIMIRFKRMQGYKTLWLPGTDHAAIATQSKVEKEIQKKEGLSRHDLGREELLRRINEFAQQSHDTIVSQVKVIGASCDWSREAFTMDEKRNIAVRTMFKKMYDDGLIYRGHRIVNWDPKGQTTIADDEIVYEERKAKMYTFKYSADFPISISTTRPETKVGDVAVAVHPDDARYAEFVGKTFEVADFCGAALSIKVIADREVDPEFGTGALGVTPAHSMTDWEIAERHDLPKPQVINEYAKMTVGNPSILGKKTTEAREAVVVWLREQNLLENEVEITQNISTAERTGGIVEPLPKLQWFIDVNKEIPGRGKTLKQIMRDPVANGDIKILPDYFNKTYFHWIDNLRDWCISRQIWYGHRIPVWYKGDEIKLSEYKKAYFLRHGESEANIQGIIGGQADHPLTQNGRDEAIKIAAVLKNQGFTRIISSDLIRAKETADIIANACGCEVTTYPELRELNVGSIANEKIDKNIPSLQRALEKKTGESLEDLELRAKEAISIIKENLSLSEKVLVVGHRSFFSIINAVNKNISKEEFIEARKSWTMDNLETKEMLFEIVPDEGWTQDEDTLDTWFSSGLWTFSTLGWPQETPDLKFFHPTNVLETGYDILFFWVARMIMMTGYALDTTPFRDVYLHGLVRDGQGRKMSKSLGNALDPLDVAQKFGADAGRMALIVGTAPGTDSKIDENKIKAYSKFSNKIWNATRFVLESIHELDFDEAVELDAEDQQSQDELTALITEITAEMEQYKFYIVAEKLYHYFWHQFADIIIERSKKKIVDGNISAKWLVYLQLKTLLKALHPFMPFITEELWSILPKVSENETKENNLLIIQSWMD